MTPVAPDDALYLCIDQGGHASRAMVFDRAGRVHAKGLCELADNRPREGWVEQDPEALISSIQAAADQALTELGDSGDRVAAAGLATQRSSIVCWDRQSGAALTPVISWQDRRAHDWLRAFEGQAGKIHSITGLMLSAHYGASKLRWCIDHVPAVADAMARGRLAMGPLASFALFKLLEEKPLFADPANAGRTLLWNLATRDWDGDLLALFGIPGDALPACVPTHRDFGTLDIRGRKIPLVVATGDQSAALFADGEPRSDTAYITVGTGAFVQRVLGSLPAYQPRLLTGIVREEGTDITYVLEGTVNGANSALVWASEQLQIDALPARLPDWLLRDANPPLFLNGVSGLGSPYWLAEFESRFVGNGVGWQKAVAVAESIVFLIMTNLDMLQSDGTAFARLSLAGGLSRIDGLCQRLADLSKLPVRRPAEFEATARGLAYQVAAAPEDWPESETDRWFTPEDNAALTARYHKWRDEMEAAIS